MIAAGSGSLFGAEVPPIEHEHDDEHEHDSPRILDRDYCRISDPPRPIRAKLN